MQNSQENPPIIVTAATAFRASFEDGRIAIDFGQIQDQPSPNVEAGASLSRRIVLDAHTAARLVSALKLCVQKHEVQWRHAAPAGGAHAEPDESGRKASLLLRLVDGLGVTHFQERSFRMSDQLLAANRFLITLNRRSLHGAYEQGLLAICDRLGMPEPFRELARQNIAGAKSFHFGFEGDGHTLFKFYLERAGTAEEASRAAAGTPVLMHLAFKWDTDEPGRSVISRYLWYPFLSEAQILERIAQIYHGSGNAQSLDIARGVLEATSGRINPEDLQYLEVQEDGNDRLSYDINFYDAGLRVRNLQPQLQQMRQQFSVRPGEFQALYDQIKSKAVGHLAGGVHRNGRDFFNVYYGVEKRNG